LSLDLFPSAKVSYKRDPYESKTWPNFNDFKRVLVIKIHIGMIQCIFSQLSRGRWQNIDWQWVKDEFSILLYDIIIYLSVSISLHKVSDHMFQSRHRFRISIFDHIISYCYVSCYMVSLHAYTWLCNVSNFFWIMSKTIHLRLFSIYVLWLHACYLSVIGLVVFKIVDVWSRAYTYKQYIKESYLCKYFFHCVAFVSPN